MPTADLLEFDTLTALIPGDNPAGASLADRPFSLLYDAWNVMNLVIVESPAKAKTINKYLGKDFTVLASYGHVRDLPAKNGSVRPEEDFDMSWEVDGKSAKRLSEIATALKYEDRLILATDPDREGEAISWHVLNALHDMKAVRDVPVRRIVFHEITEEAVNEALRHPGEVNENLVRAQESRRILDRLYGYTLSPLLWKKVQTGLSAGRVQSVALRLVVEREAEIDAGEFETRGACVGLFVLETAVVIGIEPGWTKRIVDGIRASGKPCEGFAIEGAGEIKTVADASRRAMEFVQRASEKQQMVGERDEDLCAQEPPVIR